MCLELAGAGGGTDGIGHMGADVKIMLGMGNNFTDVLSNTLSPS